MTTKNFKQTEIGEIPADWDLKPLRSVCVETTTVNPAKAPDTVIEYVDVSSVSREGCRIVGATKYAGKDAPGRARNLVRHRDVIFATVRPTLRRVALVPKELDGQVVSTAFCVIRAQEVQAHPEYLYYVVSSPDFITRVGRLERGASYPAVTDANIFTQKIALPARPEQERIAGVLSKIQRAVENQETIVADLRELKVATTAKLFREGLSGGPLKTTEIGEIPVDWEIKRLGNYANLFSGYAFKSSDFTDNGVIVVKIGSLQNGTLTIGNRTNYFPKDSVIEEFEKYTLHQGDILIALTGATTGKVSCVPKEFNGALLNQRVGKFEVFSDKLDKDFLHFFSISNYFQMEINLNILQSAQGNISPEKIENIFIPVPGLEEQKEIAGILNCIDRKIVFASKEHENLKLLFSSTLNQLMTGKIRV